MNWKITEFRQLTPCENHGMHHAFIEVHDETGKPLDGIPVALDVIDTTLHIIVPSGEKGPGKIEIPIFRGMKRCIVYVDKPDEQSERSPEFTTEIFGQDRECETGGAGNSTLHFSYKMIFQRSTGTTQPDGGTGTQQQTGLDDFSSNFKTFVTSHPELGITARGGMQFHGESGDAWQPVRTKDGKNRLLVWIVATNEIGLFPPV